MLKYTFTFMCTKSPIAIDSMLHTSIQGHSCRRGATTPLPQIYSLSAHLLKTNSTVNVVCLQKESPVCKQFVLK